MAIDSSIATQVQYPSGSQVLQPIAQVLALRNAQKLTDQELQKGQIAIGSANMDLQSKQRAADAESVLNQTLNKYTTVGPNGTAKVDRNAVTQELTQKGYAPLAINLAGQWNASDVEAHKQSLGIIKDTLANQSTQLGLHAQVIGPYLQSVTPQNPGGDPALWAQARQTFLENGWATPDKVPTTPDPRIAQQVYQAGMSAQQQTEAHQKLIDEQLAQDKFGEDKRHNVATEKNSATQTRIQQQNANTESGKLNLEKKKFELEQQFGANSSLTGDAYLQTLPAGVQAQVKAIATGDVAIPTAGSRSNKAQLLRQAVLSFDPTYTDARYATKQNFKTKGDATSVTQLATALEHLDNMNANSTKAGLSPLLNGSHTEATVRYNDDKKMFAEELGKLVKSGAVTEGEYKDLKDGLESPRKGIRNASIDEFTKLMGGKVQAIFQKYKAGTGHDLPVNEFFDAPTQQRLKKAGIVQDAAAPTNSGFDWNAHPVVK